MRTDRVVVSSKGQLYPTGSRILILREALYTPLTSTVLDCLTASIALSH